MSKTNFGDQPAAAGQFRAVRRKIARSPDCRRDVNRGIPGSCIADHALQRSSIALIARVQQRPNNLSAARQTGRNACARYLSGTGSAPAIDDLNIVRAHVGRIERSRGIHYCDTATFGDSRLFPSHETLGPIENTPRAVSLGRSRRKKASRSRLTAGLRRSDCFAASRPARAEANPPAP